MATERRAGMLADERRSARELDRRKDSRPRNLPPSKLIQFPDLIHHGFCLFKGPKRKLGLAVSQQYILAVPLLDLIRLHVPLNTTGTTLCRATRRDCRRQQLDPSLMVKVGVF